MRPTITALVPAPASRAQRRSRLAKVGVVAVTVYALSACGSGAGSTDPVSASGAPNPTTTTTTTTTTAAAAPAEDEAAVRKAFDGYKKAILAKDGEAAVGYLSEDTFGYYVALQELALDADRAALEGERLGDQIAVLTMRQKLPAEVVRTSSPQELVVEAVDAGLIGEDGVMKSAVGDVAVEGDLAKGQVVVDGQPTSLKYTFIREDGAWRLQLAKMIVLAEAALRQAAEQQGVPADELVDLVITTMVGKAKAAQAWEPLGR